MAKVDELFAEKAKQAAAIKELADKQANWTAEDRSAWDKANADYDAANKLIEEENNRLYSNEEVQKRLAEVEEEAKATYKPTLDAGARRAADPENRIARSNDVRATALQGWAMAQCGMNVRDEHRAAAIQYGFDLTARHVVVGPDGNFYPAMGGESCDLPSGSRLREWGEARWSCGGVQQQREFRAGLDVATSGAGKETIPAGFMDMLERKSLAYGRVRQVARVVNTASGNSMPWPVVDDTSNSAAILAEATTIGTSVDPTFSAVTLTSHKLSSKPVFVSAEILQDSAFNLASELASMIGERFGRGENVYFTTGTNSSQPQGVVTAAGTGVTSATAAAVTADEVLALVHSLDPSYRDLPSCGFMMHDSMILYLRKLKDANGVYLWQPGLQSSVPDRLAGYPVIVNQQMTGTTSGVPVTATKHILFGAFEKYIVRDCGGVRMYHLTERYRDVDQDCFVAFKRIDGRVLNAAAFKVLLQA